MCIQHCGDNGFTSIKTCLLHCFVCTLVRNRPRKWIEDNTCPNAGAIFFILNENATQCRGLADFINPLPGGGGGGILIHSLTRVTPHPLAKFTRLVYLARTLQLIMQTLIMQTLIMQTLIMQTLIMQTLIMQTLIMQTLIMRTLYMRTLYMRTSSLLCAFNLKNIDKNISKKAKRSAHSFSLKFRGKNER